VEGALPQMSPEPSQGSHFFHNLSSLGIPYFTVSDPRGIVWSQLEQMPAVEELTYVRHVESPEELRVLVDGSTGQGVIARCTPPGAWNRINGRKCSTTSTSGPRS
jgi:hypothetical protein